MKTEFERISEIMYTLLEHQPVIDVPYEKINDIAVALVKDGYGKISEYEAEIAELKEKCEELRNEKWDAQDDLDYYCDEMPDKIKQAKIDVLNEVKKRIYDISPYNPLVTKDNVKYFIDKLIEEVQNGEDKG